MKNFLLLLLAAVALLVAGCGDESDSERYNARATVSIKTTVKEPIKGAGYQYTVTPSPAGNTELGNLAKTVEKGLKNASGSGSPFSVDEEGDDGDDKEEPKPKPEPEPDPEPKDITRNFGLSANSATATITLTYLNSKLDNGTTAKTDTFGTWSGSIKVSTALYSRPGVKETMVNVLAKRLIDYPQDSISNKEVGIRY